MVAEFVPTERLIIAAGASRGRITLRIIDGLLLIDVEATPRAQT